MNQLFIASIVFLVSYIIIISEKVHRTVVALSGALLMIILGVLNQNQALEGVDFNTLGLLIGMMILVGISKESGIFQYIAVWAAKLAKGRAIPIFIVFGVLTALFSIILNNVATVLLIVPMVFVITNHLQVNPKPYLIGTILLSNLGGAATLIGDPPNILIGGAANLTFNDFLIHLAPISFLVCFVTLALLVFIYKKEFKTSSKNCILSLNPSDALTDIPLLKKSLFVLGLVLIGFLTPQFTGLEGATIAMGGAALLLLLTANQPDKHLEEVEWSTIFFFLGLFILVVGIEQVGIIGWIADSIIEITDGSVFGTTILMLWGSAFFSAIVDNIPFVTTMIPVISDLQTTGMDVEPLWWALAIGADFGGNMTLVGASANVVVAELAKKQGNEISFLGYMKIAVPLTFVALIISTIYIIVRYL